MDHVFESLDEIKQFLTEDDEDLSMSEMWEIVRYQQEFDLFL